MSDATDPPNDSNRGSSDLWLLSSFVDDELSAQEREALLSRLSTDPQAADIVRHYRAQKSALKALFPITTDHRSMRLSRRPSRWQSVGIAACGLALGTVLGISLGPLSHRWDGTAPAFAQRANIAYAVYAPEQRHPVEVAAAQEDHLVKWLSSRLGHPLTVPSLQEYGYFLVGGRLLPGEVGPAAQFMYQNATGQRLTLYMTASTNAEKSFHLIHDKDRRTIYWVNDRMGYALSGQAPEGEIRSIALDVCSALGGHPDRW